MGSLYRFGTLGLAVALKKGVDPLLIEQVLLFWTTYMVIFFLIRETCRMYFDLRYERAQWRFEYEKLKKSDGRLKVVLKNLSHWKHKEKHGHFDRSKVKNQIAEMRKAALQFEDLGSFDEPAAEKGEDQGVR